MTTSKEQPAGADDRQDTSVTQPDSRPAELDAEIVRDLDADDDAGDVRGGPCPASVKTGFGA